MRWEGQRGRERARYYYSRDGMDGYKLADGSFLKPSANLGGWIPSFHHRTRIIVIISENGPFVRTWLRTRKPANLLQPWPRTLCTYTTMDDGPGPSSVDTSEVLLATLATGSLSLVSVPSPILGTLKLSLSGKLRVCAAAAHLITSRQGGLKGSSRPVYRRPPIARREGVAHGFADSYPSRTV